MVTATAARKDIRFQFMSDDESLDCLLTSPQLGFDAKDTNLTRYVGNAPTIATDPTGLEPISPGDPDIGLVPPISDGLTPPISDSPNNSTSLSGMRFVFEESTQRMRRKTYEVFEISQSFGHTQNTVIAEVTVGVRVDLSEYTRNSLSPCKANVFVSFEWKAKTKGQDHNLGEALDRLDDAPEYLTPVMWDANDLTNHVKLNWFGARTKDGKRIPEGSTMSGELMIGNMSGPFSSNGQTGGSVYITESWKPNDLLDELNYHDKSVWPEYARGQAFFIIDYQAQLTIVQSGNSFVTDADGLDVNLKLGRGGELAWVSYPNSQRIKEKPTE